MRKLVLTAALAVMALNTTEAFAKSAKVESFAQDIKISNFVLGTDLTKFLDGTVVKTPKPLVITPATKLACKLDLTSAQCLEGSAPDVTETVTKPNQKFSVIAKNKGIYKSVLAGHSGLSKRVGSLLLNSKGFPKAQCEAYYNTSLKSFTNKGYKFVSADVVPLHGLVAKMTGKVVSGDVVEVRVYECKSMVKTPSLYNFKVNLKSADVAKHDKALAETVKLKAVDLVFDVK